MSWSFFSAQRSERQMPRLGRLDPDRPFWLNPRILNAHRLGGAFSLRNTFNSVD
jgi:hypothetical protein